jgi:methylenetetrahydrofolate reductase (NADPH)
MNLKELYASDKCVLSFELFPPKTDAGVSELMKVVGELAVHKPDYFTCTYGAGGSTRERTMSIAAGVRKQYGIPVASHLTCVGSTREQLREYLNAAREHGIDYIVALRGDPPKGESEFRPVDGGLSYANELVAMLRAEFPQFGIAVAGYPETHQEAPNADVDLANLKRKVDAGADVIITQLFYDNEDFFRFRDRCESVGISVPIVPGILPVLSLAQVQRIASLCKAKLPGAFVEKLGQKADEKWQFEVGVEHARQQSQDLLDAGIPGLHFYVLNKSLATTRIISQMDGLGCATHTV